MAVHRCSLICRPAQARGPIARQRPPIGRGAGARLRRPSAPDPALRRRRQLDDRVASGALGGQRLTADPHRWPRYQPRPGS
ncbi:MAG: hypothetical protein AVDCRST_MAG59-3305 [uncultured Thermomicrobiales bacterium]|uniref:Uncharacterized protein n=1 Tax=uncultured Thermomicrobiales bacterium TaxID=1645740 RepID=A0A6J4V964_9BACT|nr:MAG: hypothetical protein AVDCRST_MAG59-3305 [uncultured Thermomicrobiales bacterium]